MRQTRFLVVVWLLVVTTFQGQAQQHTVSGQVLDADNHPVRNVRIVIIRGSEAGISGQSVKDGSYSIKFPDGQPIDSVQYELTGWNPAVISGLSGARDHRINKTMYPAGATLTAYQAQEVLSALRTMYQVNHERGVSQQELRENNEPAINKLNVPPKFHGQTQEIRELYGLQGKGQPAYNPEPNPY